MKSAATTVSEYLSGLPVETRKELAKVRRAIKKRLPKGYAETMQYGMISYVVPLKVFPQGYLGKKDVPLPFASLAAQKRHLALYLMNVYGDPDLERWFKAAYSKSGKRLDMGKSCVRFQKADDLALDVIGRAIAKTPVAVHVKRYEKARAASKRRG
jgi:hypothetical protein